MTAIAIMTTSFSPHLTSHEMDNIDIDQCDHQPPAVKQRSLHQTRKNSLAFNLIYRLKHVASVHTLFIILLFTIQHNCAGASDAASANQKTTITINNGSMGPHNVTSKNGAIDPKVWIFSTVSIFIISLVGLAGVAVVPCLQKVFYNHLIQFLVALAVGSLTGDAMLHLLPHAIVNSAMSAVHLREQHDEKATVYKGLVALGGVYFFFMAEKVLALISEYRAERKQIQEEMDLHDKTDEDDIIQRRLSRATNNAVNEDVIALGLGGKALRSIDNLRRYEEGFWEHANHESNDVTEMTALHSSANANLLPVSEVKILLPEDEPVVKVKKVKDGPSHGHGHGHGHSHGTREVPNSVAAVAWMVIMGDGLHNFSDGLAIGAAFANGLAGGFSTSIAVFCHELPHELGDFAVLLKTGMKAKQALFYNMLSSVLCFVGMLIGVCLGNIESASYWIFAITGGMFIYISLVDMLPELNLINVKPGESRILHFLIQNLGILTGVSIMLVIALFEENIKAMLE